MWANFEKTFDYNSHEVTKTFDSEIPFYRTQVVQYFDISYVFPCYMRKIYIAQTGVSLAFIMVSAQWQV